jgi:glucose-1-phosphate thymidylyltransferase
MAAGRTDKAVILARGLGTRMRRADAGAALDARQQQAADAGVKAMIPIGRPFLDYVLSALADAGFRRVCLVVAPDHEAIRAYYAQAQPRRVTVHYAVQPEPKGTADAVAAAEPFAAGEPFVMVNSDNYYPAEALAGLRALDGFGAALFEQEAMFAGSNIAAERIRQFAVGEVDAQGRLRRILEKPDDATLASLPRPLWLSMNCWRFEAGIFDACRAIRPSKRGEYEVTDAVQHVIDVLGRPFHALTVRAPVLDMTSRQDVATIAPKLAAVKVEL